MSSRTFICETTPLDSVASPHQERGSFSLPLFPGRGLAHNFAVGGP
jgi:hypothetical protein